MIEHIPCTREIGMKTTATHAHKNAHIVLLDFTLSGFSNPSSDTILTDELSSTTTSHLTATCQAFALNLRVTVPRRCFSESEAMIGRILGKAPPLSLQLVGFCRFFCLLPFGLP